MPRLIITEGEIMLQEAMKTLEDAEAKAAEIVKEAGKKAEAIYLPHFRWRKRPSLLR